LKEAFSIVGLKRDLLQEDADSFQDHVDAFYRPWVRIYGQEGCTNYIHLLSTGHIKEEIENLGNLYRYSQEGVEAMIGLVKTYFFRRTMRGGGKSVENGNKVLPLARWLQRRMFFLLTWNEEAITPGMGVPLANDQDSGLPEEEFDDEAMARDVAEAYDQRISMTADV